MVASFLAAWSRDARGILLRIFTVDRGWFSTSLLGGEEGGDAPMPASWPRLGINGKLHEPRQRFPTGPWTRTSPALVKGIIRQQIAHWPWLATGLVLSSNILLSLWSKTSRYRLQMAKTESLVCFFYRIIIWTGGLICTRLNVCWVLTAWYISKARWCGLAHLSYTCVVCREPSIYF